MATLNFEKLALASIILDGVKVGVKTILKRKGEAVMANGVRLPLENIRAIGRGFVYEPPVKASGKTSSKPAATKPAATVPAKAPAMAPANAGGALGRGAPVTAEELQRPGKHVTTKDGERLAVELVLPKKGIVKLAGNIRIEMANIIRKGKGLFEVDVTDVTPASTKPAATKPASAKPAANKTETKPATTAHHGHAPVDIHTLRNVRVKVGGRFQTIEKLFPSKGQVKTVEGTRLEVAHIHQKGTKFFYTAVEEMKPVAAKPEVKAAPAKPEPKAGGIRRREETVDVSKPAGKTASAKAPAEKAHKVKPIEALTADKTEEVRLFLNEFLKTEIGKHFDLKFITSHAMFNDRFTSVTFSFGIGSMPPKEMARIMAELEAEHEADTDLLNGSADDEDDSDDEEEEEENEETEEDDEDFDDSQLDGSGNGADDEEETEEDDEDDEEETEEDEEEETEEDEEEETEEEDDADDAEENDEFEEDDADDSEEEESDIDAQVDKGVAALEKKFGKHSSFRAYAENYLLSEAVESAFGDEMEIGVTKLEVPGKGVYVLVGLHDDGEVVLMNLKNQKLRKATISAVAGMEEA